PSGLGDARAHHGSRTLGRIPPSEQTFEHKYEKILIILAARVIQFAARFDERAHPTSRFQKSSGVDHSSGEPSDVSNHYEPDLSFPDEVKEFFKPLSSRGRLRSGDSKIRLDDAKVLLRPPPAPRQLDKITLRSSGSGVIAHLTGGRLPHVDNSQPSKMAVGDQVGPRPMRIGQVGWVR